MLVFVGGSVALVAGAFAVVVVVGAIVDEFEDSTIAGPTATTATTATVITITAATTVPAGGGENGLLVGECLDDDELDSFLAGDDYSVMECDDPHDYEVYHVHEFAGGPYPGDETVLDELDDVCWGEFESYVDRDYETSVLDIYRVWPSQGLWDSGYRIGECLLFDSEGKKLTGSA
ncbi:MAG: septum formation family protein, partial [Actinomycetota bacterium]|nr:septum formation family protein [Actinomycetota bacterium]